MPGVRALPEGAFLCTACHTVKPHAAFYPTPRPDRTRPVDSWCKSCRRAHKVARRRSGADRESDRARRVRDRDRMCAWRRAYYRSHRDEIRARRDTVRGRLLGCRCQAILRYRAATDAPARARHLALIAALEAELVRIDADLGVARGEWTWRPFVAPDWPGGLPPGVERRSTAYRARARSGRDAVTLGPFATPAIAAAALAAREKGVRT